MPVSGAGTWTSYTLDIKNGLLYVPGGNPAPDFVQGGVDGASARESNLYSDSVVVLDAKTGDYKNHFQVVPKDWHDYDVSNPPILIQTMGGKQIMAVAPKDGHLYGYDLATQQAALPRADDHGRECATSLRARASTCISVPVRWEAMNGTRPAYVSDHQPDHQRRGRLVRHGDGAGRQANFAAWRLGQPWTGMATLNPINMFGKESQHASG